MKSKFDIGQFVDTVTIVAITNGLATRFVKRRKELKITQFAMSKRSGVSYASIRRFESIGEISLSSLLKLSNAIDCLEDFEHLFKNQKITNLKDLFKK